MKAVRKMVINFAIAVHYLLPIQLMVPLTVLTSKEFILVSKILFALSTGESFHITHLKTFLTLT